jgi:hypothetical protein
MFTAKKANDLPVPSRDVPDPARESLVSDIPAGVGKMEDLSNSVGREHGKAQLSVYGSVLFVI